MIGSAVSGDLLNWSVEPGVRLELGTNRATGVPEAVALPDGRVRLYYVTSGGAGPERIDSAISTDGLTFAPEPGDRLTGGYVDPAVVQLANGSWLMLCSTSPSSKAAALRRHLVRRTLVDGDQDSAARRQERERRSTRRSSRSAATASASTTASRPPGTRSPARTTS